MMRARRAPMLVGLLMLVIVCGAEVSNGKKLGTGRLSRRGFPKGFVFGTATSAYQVEGMASKDGRGPSIWDVFIQKPEGVGKVNWKGVAYYNRLINYLLERGNQILKSAYSNWLYNVPWGLYKAVTYIKEHYGNPTVILSENGMDDPGNLTFAKALKDITRIKYCWSYMAELKKAIDEGANVVGYFAWSLLDNFEWRSGYTSRFGIVYVDYKTLKRYPKMSAYWFKSILRPDKN
ncbi:Glycoside hydrolase family 1 [Dillenia turbinata]|uniref:Glycoside hydrolase family 1 n=1 Tax=Dillenia turbinata TaxID=194707 RepID=A0AAN8V852_9MAGN